MLPSLLEEYMQRVLNQLAQCGLTIEEARLMSDAELLKLPNIGQKAIKVIRKDAKISFFSFFSESYQTGMLSEEVLRKILTEVQNPQVMARIAIEAKSRIEDELNFRASDLGID
jgi:DNA-directed RNA polymerase alpha subunit